MQRGVLIQHLMDEHESIKKGLDVLNEARFDLLEKKQVQPRDLQDFVRCLSFVVERIHHGKEEEILFPSLNQLGCLREGGPKCMMFMGYKIEEDPVRKLITHLKRSELDDCLSPAMKEIVSQKSPLSLPLEEHQAGHTAVQALLQVLDQETIPEEHRLWLAQLLGIYLRMMELHIRKEDECLFVVADREISKVEQEEMMLKARAYEEELRKDPGYRSCQELEELAREVRASSWSSS